ncbi:hypothetical protein MMC20_004843 [Loxospora ochrophaea]|nr:hypothetical protein [Loxospora ochrophaea]
MASSTPRQPYHVRDIKVGMMFESISEGQEAVACAVIARGESFKYWKNDKNKAWVVTCKAKESANCPFRVRIHKTKDGAKLTKYVPHTCPFSTHQNFRHASSAKLLAANPDNVALVAHNPRVAPKDIQTLELTRHGNKISYKQAHRTIQLAAKEVFGDAAPPPRKKRAKKSTMEKRNGERQGSPSCQRDIQIEDDGFRSWTFSNSEASNVGYSCAYMSAAADQSG